MDVLQTAVISAGCVSGCGWEMDSRERMKRPTQEYKGDLVPHRKEAEFL